MKKRFTVVDLRNVLAEINTELVANKSPYYYEEQRRNGYLAVDIWINTIDGRKVKINCLAADLPPRKLAEKAKNEYKYYLDKYNHYLLEQ